MTSPPSPLRARPASDRAPVDPSLRRASFRSVKTASLSAVAGGVVLVLIVSLAPLAGAAPSTSWSAPYYHLAKANGMVVSSSGCHAYAILPFTPTQSLSAGTFSAEARAVAGNCGSGLVSASAQAWLGFTGFGFVAAQSHVNVSVEWQLTWNAFTIVSGPAGSLSYLNDSAAVDVIVGSVLIDAATGGMSNSYTGTANLGLFDTGTYATSMSARAHGAPYWTNATFAVTTGTAYDIQLSGDVYASASCSVPGVTAWAQAEIGSGSIVSVSIS